MIYTTTSVKEVIARIIRNTRLTDSSYFDDMLEWIPEAMQQLKTKQSLETKSINLEIVSHAAKLPCGLDHIKAVIYNNNRLREGSSVLDIKNIPSGLSSISDGAIFQTDSESTIENHLTDRISSSLTNVTSSQSEDWFKLQLNYIQTSFEEGIITLHYATLPIDDDGYPLIPDNENYKTALYWYVLSMMLGSGYEHKVFKEQECLQRFELYAGRALGQIKYPSVDAKEKTHRALTRLIPPQNYYLDYFINAEQYSGIRK